MIVKNNVKMAFCSDKYTRVLTPTFYALLISVLVTLNGCQGEDLQTAGLPTVTVRGFLNFKTTVDGTVIVFTPASELPRTATNTQQPPQPPTKPALTTNAIIHGNVLESKETVAVDIQDIAYTQPPSSSTHSDVGDLAHLGHKVKEPFLQHISDNAVLPSTVQTNNDLETEANKKVSLSQNHYPTGLVTILDGTHVESGKTTIFETKVIGTYIDGKYAQILQSTSKITIPTTFYTPSYKTVDASTKQQTSEAPTIADLPSSTSTQSSETASTVLDLTPSSIKESPSPTTETSTETSSSSSPVVNELSSSITTENVPVTVSSMNENYVSTKTPILRSSFQTLETTSKSSTGIQTQSLDNVKTTSMKSVVSEAQEVATKVRNIEEDDDESAHSKSRSLRTSSTRIRFSAPRRPSQTVRLNRFKVRLTLRQNSTEGDFTTPSEEEELEDEENIREDEDADTAATNETPMPDVDPAHVVYQETTITSEVTLHVGRRKSVRTLTITTSVPMRINPTDDRDILQTYAAYQNHDHGTEENEKATQSVVSRTFTTTERTYATTVVPVFDGKQTSYHTLTESFFIMKIITAYKTLPPSDLTILEAFEDDPETAEAIPTVLDMAANVQSSVTETLPQEHTATVALETVQTSLTTQATGSVNNVQNYSGISNPLLSLGQALSNNPLAAVYLGLQQLNAQMTLYSTVTQTSTYLTTDTIYSTKVIRFYDGRTTRFRTISDPLSTKKRTVTTTITSVQPYINSQAYQQQQQLQKLIAATQLAVPQQQFSTVTTTITTATTATSLSTRIYTLIYNGFSTKFRTVTSTKTFPTTLTITSTKEVPITATQPPVLPFAYPYSAP